jgi:hypothetical protein
MPAKKAAVAITHAFLIAVFHILQQAVTFADLRACRCTPRKIQGPQPIANCGIVFRNDTLSPADFLNMHRKMQEVTEYV